MPTSINLSSDQIIYKLGAIDESLKNIQINITQSISRLEDKIIDTQTALAREITSIAVQLETTKNKVEALEDWRNQLFTKLGFIISAISLFWVIFAEPIKTTVEGYFG